LLSEKIIMDLCAQPGNSAEGLREEIETFERLMVRLQARVLLLEYEAPSQYSWWQKKELGIHIGWLQQIRRDFNKVEIRLQEVLGRLDSKYPPKEKEKPKAKEKTNAKVRVERGGRLVA